MTQRAFLWLFPVLVPVLVLTGCTQFPELDGTIRPELENAAYPELVPLEPILAAAAPSTLDPVEIEAGLDGRIAGLRARASQMRGTVISDADKKRLDAGVTPR